MSFLSQFTPYSFPTLGLVRLPSVVLTPEQRAIVSAAPKVSNTTFLKRLAWAGYQAKVANGSFVGFTEDEVKDRLRMEFAVFEKTGIIDYLLLIWDILSWCDAQGIERGPGRGSVCGSLTCFFIGVTKVDSLKRKLNFTRFLSEARAKPQIIDGITYADGKNLCDIDSDISFVDRPRVIEYVDRRHPGKTCKISTRLQLTGKTALKDVLKAYLEMDEGHAKVITDNIEVQFGKVEDLDKAIERSKPLKQWAAESARHQKALDIARALEGLNIAKGQHPSGVLISYHDLDGTMPTELSKTKDVVTAYDMNMSAMLAPKIDLLGLRSVDLIAETARHVGIKMDDIDIEHPSLYDYIGRSDHYLGLFQIEDGLTKQVARKVGPRSIADLSAVLALSRPGSLRFIDDFVKYVKDGTFKPIYPPIDKILLATGNILLYQEQINEICQQVYRMSAIDADEVRRCVSGDTHFISKTRGWITIDRLMSEGYKDDWFLVMDEHGNQSWDQISDIWSNGRKTVNYVEAQNGLTVKATSHHSFMTCDGWKTVNWLDDQKDHLVGAKQVEYDGKDIISRDMAVVIAGIVAEGHYPHHGKGGTFVNHDEGMMNTFIAAFNKSFVVPGSFDKNGKVYRFHVKHGQELCKFMSSGLAKTKKLPDVMMGMTKESTRDFLSYLLACEGGIAKSSRQFEFSSKSYELIQQVQYLLMRFGIYSFSSQKIVKGYESEGPYHRLYVLGSDNQKRLFNELTGLWGSIKKEQLAFILQKDRTDSSQGNMVPHDIVKKLLWQHSHVFSTREYGISGNVYKNDLSWDRFRRMCALTKDTSWISLCDGQHRYLKLRPIVKKSSSVEVFDFTMANPAKPYIVANGLVIHNCIGKKIKEDMAKWEPVLYANGKTHGIPDEVTKYFWDTCNASADYLFSVNHSTAYSYITAMTAYLKANHPREFTLALLKMSKHEPNSQTVLTAIIAESKQIGVDILPPDLTRSGEDFAVEATGVRFGLSHIRGISDSNMGKLLSFRRDFPSKLDVFAAAQEAKISISVLVGLIMSGALDSRGTPRPKMTLEAQTYNILTPREALLVRRLAPQYGDDLLAMLKDLGQKTDEKGKPYIKDTRLATLRRDFAPYEAMYRENTRNEELTAYVNERHYLGFSYSSTLYDIFSKRVEDLKRLSECATMVAKERFRTVAIVADVKNSVSLKSKKSYLRFIINDESAQIRCMLHGEEKIQACQQFHGKLPEPGDIVIINATRGDGDMSFIETLVIQDNPIKK